MKLWSSKNIFRKTKFYSNIILKSVPYFSTANNQLLKTISNFRNLISNLNVLDYNNLSLIKVNFLILNRHFSKLSNDEFTLNVKSESYEIVENLLDKLLTKNFNIYSVFLLKFLTESYLSCNDIILNKILNFFIAFGKECSIGHGIKHVDILLSFYFSFMIDNKFIISNNPTFYTKMNVDFKWMRPLFKLIFIQKIPQENLNKRLINLIELFNIFGKADSYILDYWGIAMIKSVNYNDKTNSIINSIEHITNYLTLLTKFKSKISNEINSIFYNKLLFEYSKGRINELPYDKKIEIFILAAKIPNMRMKILLNEINKNLKINFANINLQLILIYLKEVLTKCSYNKEDIFELMKSIEIKVNIDTINSIQSFLDKEFKEDVSIILGKIFDCLKNKILNLRNHYLKEIKELNIRNITVHKEYILNILLSDDFAYSKYLIDYNKFLFTEVKEYLNYFEEIDLNLVNFGGVEKFLIFDDNNSYFYLKHRETTLTIKSYLEKLLNAFLSVILKIDKNIMVNFSCLNSFLIVINKDLSKISIETENLTVIDRNICIIKIN